MELRPYHASDLAPVLDLFRGAVLTVCAGDYAPAECSAWARAAEDAEGWGASLLAHHTLVAVEGDALVGFADLDGDYLDRLYVHRDFQRRGAASALCGALEEWAKGAGMERVETHASRTARGFFLGRGYRVLRAQRVPCRGERLENFVMEKELSL